MVDDGGASLISTDGMVTIQIVGVSASVIFPYTIRSRKSSGSGSPWWSRKKDVKWLCVCFQLHVKNTSLRDNTDYTFTVISNEAV